MRLDEGTVVSAVSEFVQVVMEVNKTKLRSGNPRKT
jgi:hypothetical protein